jgi:hypothetical protein
VLDVLTETVGTCSIAKLRIRDGLHNLPGVCDGLNMLRHISSPLHDDAPRRAAADSFCHPITGESIEISVTF